MNKAKTGTKEWSEHSVNCCTGCSHDCIYCYAAERYCLRYKKRPRERWRFEHVRPVRRRQPKFDGRVMFPTTHDITLGNARACLRTLQQLVEAGNDVLVVSKMAVPIAAMMIDTMGPWRDQLEFRISIGSVSEDVKAFWEPGAPANIDRVASLTHLIAAGFRTSVSCEPLLEPWLVVPHVASLSLCGTETIWIGKLNHIKARCGWMGDLDQFHTLRHWQTDEKVMEVVEAVGGNEKIRFKDSYQAVIDRQNGDD